MKTKALGLSIGGLAIAAFAAVALLSYSPTPHAAPDKPSKPKGKITFDQEYVKEFIAPGEVGDYTISITSPTSLDNTVIEIPGSLSNYVTFYPNRITTDPGQRPFVITMTVDIPEDTPYGDLEGTLQVTVDDGSNATIAKPLPVTISVNQDGLPPDPGEAGKLTLEGIDLNNNGVRDDVERFIALSDNSDDVKSAFTQMAVALGDRMKASVVNDRDRNFAVVLAKVNALHCLASLSPSYDGGTREASAKMVEVTRVFYNTDERSQANFIVETNIPSGKTSAGIIQGLDACTFTPTYQ